MNLRGWNQLTKASVIPAKNSGKNVRYYKSNSTVSLPSDEFPSLANTVALEQDLMVVELLQSMFPEIPIEVIMDTAVFHRSNLSSGVESLLNYTPNRKLNMPKSSPIIKPIKEKSPQKFHGTHTITNYEFVDSNSDQDTYLRERKEAIKAVKRRDKCFKLACRAYEENQHKLAKQYATEGHKLNQEYLRLNSEACERIFATRNQNNGSHKIDLHGLQANEAIEKVIDRLHTIIHDGQTHQLEIITGSGKHQQGNPILRPTIRELLEEYSLPFTEPIAGKFMVKVKPSITL